MPSFDLLFDFDADYDRGVRAHYPSGFSQIFQKWEVYQAVDIHLRE